MTEKVRKITYSLLAAAGICILAAVMCIALAKPEADASALVCFTGNGGVSSLSNAAAANIESAAMQSGTDKGELEGALSVVPFGSGAQLVLSELSNPDNAPVIMASILKSILKSDDTGIRVLSYCDMTKSVQFPTLSVSISAGMAGGLAVYAAISAAALLRKKKASAADDVISKPAKTAKAEPEEIRSDKKNDAASADTAPKAVISDTEPDKKAISIIGADKRFYEEAVNLGVLPDTAPNGLEAAGYMRIARALSAQKTPLIIAVSPAAAQADKIPYSVKAASYLACSFGALGKRTAVIECDLRNPSLGSFFRKSGKGGISDIALGRCTIPESVVLNAKHNVDIYAEKAAGSEAANITPSAIFSSPFYNELLHFMSDVYDVILLTAPLAYKDEWKYIIQGCDGIITASSDERKINPVSAAEILKSNIMFTAFCTKEENTQ